MDSFLEDLLDHLPSHAQGPKLLAAAAQRIRYVSEPRPEFVEPELSIKSGSLDSAQAVVISAPAAVGKTMLAEHLAHRSGAGLWDLAGFLLGDNFAIGTLATAHGQGALGEVLARLADGSFAVVADALDEARLRVSFDAYTAFLGDLAEQILKGSTAGRPPFVLLARAETGELAVDWLEESGVSVAALNIEFFDRERAQDFVERQIDAQGGDPGLDGIARARETIFAQALTLFDVGSESEPWPEEARRFLGYAPVLVAISRYLLDAGNPQRIVEQFSRTDRPGGLWGLLRTLIEDILAREQQKVVSAFRDGLDPGLAASCGFEDWGALFGRDEQRGWLLNRALGTAAPEIRLPVDLEGVYRRKVGGWLPEHPFVGEVGTGFASPVFEDYLYAEALLNESPAAKADVRTRAAAASYRPTEMLARFLIAAEVGGERLEIADLPNLYESLAAAREAGDEMRLQISDTEDGLEVVITLGAESIELLLSDDGAAICFTRRLDRASIELAEHRVRLGGEGQPFEIGPQVTVTAPEIEIAAGSLLVRGTSAVDGDVILAAEEIAVGDGELRIEGGGKSLKVASKADLTYPLVNHRIEVEGRESLGDAELEGAKVLFRVLSFFKSEGYEGLGAHAEPIDRRARRNRRFGEMLSYAMSRTLISKEKKIYRLHPELLGLDFSKVRARVVTPETAEFLRDFASKHSAA
jgi:hypothetical protein